MTVGFGWIKVAAVLTWIRLISFDRIVKLFLAKVLQEIRLRDLASLLPPLLQSETNDLTVVDTK